MTGWTMPFGATSNHGGTPGSDYRRALSVYSLSLSRGLLRLKERTWIYASPTCPPPVSSPDALFEGLPSSPAPHVVRGGQLLDWNLHVSRNWPSEMATSRPPHSGEKAHSRRITGDGAPPSPTRNTGLAVASSYPSPTRPIASGLLSCDLAFAHELSGPSRPRADTARGLLSRGRRALAEKPPRTFVDHC